MSLDRLAAIHRDAVHAATWRAWLDITPMSWLTLDHFTKG